MLKNKLPEEKMDTLLTKGQIPIIDLNFAGTEECPIKSVVNRVSTLLQKSLNEKGLAMLVNHGITEEKLKTAWKYLDEFVKLPMDVREKFLRTDDNNHGYIRPGQEKLDGKTLELRHAFNICTLKLATLPDEPLPGFRDHISIIAKDFKNLSGLILQALAVSLDLDINFFTEKHSHMLSDDNDNATTLRLLYYPPLIVDDDNKCELVRGQLQYSYQRCTMDKPDLGIDVSIKLDEIDNSFTRCAAHSDYGTFTLLAQDSEGGLEVKFPDSERWQRVGHLPGAILINTGEILATWTSEKYPALPHRVVIPKQEHLKIRGRHSIAFFCHPDNVTEIKPIEIPTSSTTSSDNKKSSKKPFQTAKTKVYTAYQLVQSKFKRTYAS